MALLTMWTQAGFGPDSFWTQTPETFRAAIDGVTARLKAESEGAISSSWNTAAFVGAAMSKGGLKPLRHYTGKQSRKMSNQEMLANMRILAMRANRSAT